MYTRFLYPRPVANGESWFHAGVPVLVNVNAFVDPSANGAPETELNNNCVFVIAVNGMVDGVKFEVYSAVPLRMRTLEI